LKGRVSNDIRFLMGVLSRALRGKFRGTEVTVAYVPSILSVYAALLVRRHLTECRLGTVVHDIESGLSHSLALTSGKVALKMMRFIERLALNWSDHVIVLTAGMQSELREIGCRKPISVISIWASAAPEAPLPESPITIMYSGNFGKKQNLDQLVPLIRRLSDENQPIRVVMQGDGSEKARLQRLFQEVGIRNTEFAPLVPSSDLIKSLQSASIHLVPQAFKVANYALPSKLFSIMAAG